MAAGLPVIALDTAALPEMVLDGESGLLIPPDAPDPALLGAVERLLDDPGLRASLGAEARRRFAQHYDARKTTGDLVEVLRGVVR